MKVYKTPIDLVENEYKKYSQKALDNAMANKRPLLNEEDSAKFDAIKQQMSNQVNDWDLFNRLYYTPQKYGRSNYVEGEEEEIWNKLSKHFDLPQYEPNKYGFTINDKDKTIGLMTKGISDGKGFGGWKVAPQNLGLLKRR